MADQGIWLSGGGQLPDPLLAALDGQLAWGGPKPVSEQVSCPGSAPPYTAGLYADGSARLEDGFCQGGVLDELAPGPELALLLPGACDATGLDDAQLTGVVRGWRRVCSWAAAMEHAAVAELASRRIGEARAAGARVTEAERCAAAEVAVALTLTRTSAEALVGRAMSLADLPGTSAALASGAIDMPRALVILTGVAGLDARLAGQVEARVLAGAPTQTSGELRKAVAGAVIAADPDAADQRLSEAQKSARVERWAEPSGTAAIAGRDLPPAQALAAGNRINALAAALKADGATASMDLLRSQVFVGLLLGHPIAAAAHEPVSFAPVSIAGRTDDLAAAASRVAADGVVPAIAADAGHSADAGAAGGESTDPVGPVLAGPPGPAVPALAGAVNLTIPLQTLLGLSDRPGEVAGFGPVTSATAAQILAATGPRLRWCITITDGRGRAAGHGCATRAPTSDGWSVTVAVHALAADDCTHQREADGYRAPPRLRHVIQVRHRACVFPGCGRPASQCDLDHTLGYDHGGLTCECNLAPLCRAHHKIKQAAGWRLDQPSPGVLHWVTPAGWRYTVTRDMYPI